MLRFPIGLLLKFYIYLMEIYSINKDHHLSDYKDEFLESEFWVIYFSLQIMEDATSSIYDGYLVF